MIIKRTFNWNESKIESEFWDNFELNSEYFSLFWVCQVSFWHFGYLKLKQKNKTFFWNEMKWIDFDENGIKVQLKS